MSNRFVAADPNKCIGCRTCEIACAVAHSEQDIFTAKTEDIQFQPRLTVIKTAKVSAPVQCRQCKDAPCASVCPVNCISNKDGYMHVDEAVCIGCKTCMVACPYGVIDLVSQYRDGEKILQERFRYSDAGEVHTGKEKIIAIKCDLCSNREKGPACIDVCPTSALRIINHEDIEE